jgi:hypothetical protein
MSDPASKFAAIKAMHEGALSLTEGGRIVALLPSFTFQAAGNAETMDVLLVPFEHSGYATRLFFERQIPNRGQNWTQHRIVERNWWAPSFRDVAASLPWTAMLCAHLREVA